MVSVPVLSEQMVVALPIVSQASRWRTRLLSLIIFYNISRFMFFYVSECMIVSIIIVLMDARMQGFIYVCMNVCMYAYMHACMYACMHVCMYVCMYACMHV